jgi:predicted glycoside hydrolase/deacetylase ChbG (UPF0249 family)
VTVSDPASAGTPLIVCADDFGLTAGTSRAILEAHHHGVVTATSVLALAPGALDRVGWLDDVPGLGVGVHLALVGEDPPLLSATEVPSLVDRRGRLARSWRTLVPRLVAGRVDPADIRRELHAQVTAVRERHPIDHLDTHQHLHLWPSVGEVVVELAQLEGIGRVRLPRPSRSGAKAKAIGHLAQRLEACVERAGLAATVGFAGIDEAGGWAAASLTSALGRLAATSSSVEINVHPGPADDPDRGRYQWQYGWAQELAALTSDPVRDAVQAGGYRLCRTLHP